MAPAFSLTSLALLNFEVFCISVSLMPTQGLQKTSLSRMSRTAARCQVSSTQVSMECSFQFSSFLRPTMKVLLKSYQGFAWLKEFAFWFLSVHRQSISHSTLLRDSSTRSATDVNQSGASKYFVSSAPSLLHSYGQLNPSVFCPSSNFNWFLVESVSSLQPRADCLVCPTSA